jgi:deoxyribonuclease-1
LHLNVRFLLGKLIGSSGQTLSELIHSLCKLTLTKGMHLKALLVFTLVTLASLAHADQNYYPTSFIEKIQSKTLSNDELKSEINTLLTTPHKRDSKGGRDTLGCETPGVDNCYTQRNLGYDGARKVLFGKIHLEQKDGQYFIRDVYCHKIFAGNANVKPGAIPNNNSINCEHTWPQSKFSSAYPKDVQKADLHHLFPTDSKANSVRGNYDFADISTDNGSLDENCSASKSGSSNAGGSDDLFEPPTEHKGNVARALFYFSVRYKIKIPAQEEEVLRRWTVLDPVDDAEMQRNEMVQYAQGNRNPFVDFPELVNYINRF